MTRASPSRVTKLSSNSKRILPSGNTPFRLRIAGGLQSREEGFLGIDSFASDNVDHIVDIKAFPWPINSDTVDTIFVADYLQKLDGGERISFMNECGRVLKVGSQLIVKSPHWSSMRSISDPTVKFPPLCEASFVYFNKEWRDRERIGYGITCDFDFGYGFGLDPDIQVRNDEFQRQATKHWVNAIVDLHVTLTKKS